jgi:60s Acidic ribosomal protein
LGLIIRKSEPDPVPGEDPKLTLGKALEGRDVKDMLLNVGSGGGAAAPVAGGAAAAGGAGGAAEEAPKEEEKEEGMIIFVRHRSIIANPQSREGRVRRRYGLRSFRLSL